MEEIIYLLLTLACELPLVAVCLPVTIRRQGMIVMLFVNCMTHPLAWLFTAHHVSWYVVELAVIVVEMLVLAWFFPQYRRLAMLSALCANAFSATLGLFITRL